MNGGPTQATADCQTCGHRLYYVVREHGLPPTVLHGVEPHDRRHIVAGHGFEWAEDLLPDLRRNRGLALRVLILAARVIREVNDGEPFDYEQGLCFWCSSAVSPSQGKRHRLDCPWDLLRATLESPSLAVPRT